MPELLTDHPPQRRRSPSAGTIVLAIFLGLILGAGALLLFIRQATTGLWNDVATKITHRELRIDTSQPTVVSKIQRLERLESVTYTMDKVVEGDREGRVLPEFLTGDKILLEVHGQAIAGVDLGQLKSSDVQVTGRAVHVHLPPAQLFVVSLDSQKTHVYSRETGLLVPTDPSLESEIRAKAEQDLRQSALAAGILNTAHQNAAATLRTMLLGLGFEQVVVD